MSEIIQAIMILATLVFIYFHDKNVAKERQQLYDRIQAKDFIEYKNTVEPIETKPREEKEITYVEL